MLSLRSDTLFVMVLFHSVAFKTFYIQLLWNVNIVHDCIKLFLPYAIVTFPSSMTRIRLQDKTVFSLWAMISMVQSEKASLIVVCTSASVSVSIAAVASSSIRIYNQPIHLSHWLANHLYHTTYDGGTHLFSKNSSKILLNQITYMYLRLLFMEETKCYSLSKTTSTWIDQIQI